MPRIKRWFPVSHDINKDPEMWDLCAKFGDKALRCWLEILSIADRNEGDVPGSLNSVSTSVAWSIRCRSTKVRQMIDSMMTMNWIYIDGCLKVTKWAKYHITREDKKILLASLPSEPSEPSEHLKIQIAPSVDSFSMKKGLDPKIKTWSDQIYQVDTKKFGRLIQWIKAAERTYSTTVVAASLERFVPFAREVDDWWPYLDRILDKEETKYNASHTKQESDRIKKQERAWLKG